MVTSGYQNYESDHFVTYLNVQSLHCTPETNIILYIKYTSMKKKVKTHKTKVKTLNANTSELSGLTIIFSHFTERKKKKWLI